MPPPKTRGGNKTRRRLRPAPKSAVQPAGKAARLLPLALLALFSLFAWLGRGVHEDGFFYLRVADVFLHGGGLAYNPGERYETNTDFLWTLLLIPGVAVGIDDILWMQIVGVAIYALALWATFALARKLIPDAEAALAALVLLGTHYTFTHFAATGFGAVLQALAAVCALLGLARFGGNPNLRNGAVLGIALSFLALCRLDSVVLGAPVVLAAMFFAWRAGRAALPGIVLALGIPAVVSAALLAWKLHYYGDIFPATYYTKGAAEQAGLDLTDFKRRQGITYLTAYWRSYFLWLAAAVAAFGAWKMFGRKRPKGPGGDGVRAPILWAAAGMCVLWHGYMLQVGGGYAEFRFMATQAPMMTVLLAWGFSGLARHWRAAAVLAAMAFSILHWRGEDAEIATGVLWGKYMLHTRLDSNLRTETYGPYGFEEHRLMGVALADLFAPLGDYPPEVKAASAGGGVSAHYSKLPWVELHGYADARISRAAADDLWLNPDETLTGHHAKARPKWLARHGVNLAAEASVVYPRIDFSAPIPGAGTLNPRLVWAALASFSPVGRDLELPPDSQLFALPLADGRFTPVLYFNRNATIDRVLDGRGIERVDVF